jgi:hypothetical protein
MNMFKVKSITNPDYTKTVYAVSVDEDGYTTFLFHYLEGWNWEGANLYEPCEE